MTSTLTTQPDTAGRNGKAPKLRRGPEQVWRSENLSKLFDRLPPHALEAEMALLGSMMLDAQVTAEVIDVVRSPDDFWKPAHGHIFKALVDLYEQHNAGDIAMLYQLLVDRGVAESIGGPDYLEELANSTPVAINALHYARIVAGKSLLRRFIDACCRGVHMAYTEGEDVATVIDRGEQAIFDVAQAARTGRAATGGQLGPLVANVVEAAEQHDGRLITGMPTAFRDFDDMTSGLHPGDVVILAARPSMGKTALALNIATNVALLDGNGGGPVGVFSLEMSAEQLATRIACSQANVDAGRLRRGIYAIRDMQALREVSANLADLPLYIDDSASLTVMELRARARRMVAAHGIRLLVIDYLQLMRGSAASARESRNVEITDISRGIKAIARELRIPILCLSQLNRSAEIRDGNRPRLADLRDSGSIEQDADVVMMLYRQDYYDVQSGRSQDPNWQPDNTAEVIIAKQRNGPTGTVKLVWDGASTTFRDFTPCTEQSPAYDRPAPPRFTHTHHHTHSRLFDDNDDPTREAHGPPVPDDDDGIPI